MVILGRGSRPLLSANDQIALVERIRRGDPGAADDFVRVFRDRVWTMLLARTRDREEAADLLQDVLFAAWSGVSHGRLRDPERLGAFVHGIARNIVNNRRREAASGPVEVPLAPEIDVAIDPPDFDDRERRRLVRAAMAALEPSDRRVLLLTLVENLHPREIARRLRVSSEVVRKRKTRALKRLVDRVRELSRSGGR